MISPVPAILFFGASLGAACPAWAPYPSGGRYRHRYRMPTHIRRPDPNKKRRRKARQAAQRRNR